MLNEIKPNFFNQLDTTPSILASDERLQALLKAIQTVAGKGLSLQDAFKCLAQTAKDIKGNNNFSPAEKEQQLQQLNTTLAKLMTTVAHLNKTLKATQEQRQKLEQLVTQLKALDTIA